MSHIRTLGPEGSYCSQVAKQLAKPGTEMIYCESNRETILQLGNAIGIIPIYNEYGKVVTETMTALYEYHKKCPIKVIGTIQHKIHHVLAKKKGHGDIHTVYSHEQAITQCQKNIELSQFNTVSTNSTTKYIDNLKDGEGIIVSKKAATQNKLNIVNNNFGPTDNYTQFAVISNKEITQNINCTKEQISQTLNVKGKTIAILKTENDIGALAATLTKFQTQGINMEFIVSYNAQKLCEFMVLIDTPEKPIQNINIEIL